MRDAGPAVAQQRKVTPLSVKACAMISVVGTRANQACARLATSSIAASVATSGVVSARASSQNATTAITLNSGETYRRQRPATTSAMASHTGKRCRRFGCTALVPGYTWMPPGNRLRNVRRETLAKEDRVPISGGNSSSSGSGWTNAWWRTRLRPMLR